MRLKLFGLACLCLLISACGRDWLGGPPGACIFDADCIGGRHCINGQCVDLEISDPDGGIRLKDFGEACDENEECLSTYCLAHPAGAFCTQRCDEGCPDGWACKLVPDPHGGDGLVGLCALEHNRLCGECTDDKSCNVVGSDWCMAFDDGNRYCGQDCTWTGCPAGYACLPVEREGQQGLQCLPDSMTCRCEEETAGMLRGCQRENELGICSGYELCEPPDGWTDCNATEPAAESCNGGDDDCDGFYDEDLVGVACFWDNEFGRCDGMKQCRGFEGWVCDASEPGPESCDAVDNDCDGLTDEDFVDEAGRYVSVAHCGGCDRNCDQLLSHATQTACRIETGEAFCRALVCEEGYYVYGEGLACLLLPATLCQACASDADCIAPGSLCLDLGPERFCGRDCGPDSPYGADCPMGYACQPINGALQCLPESQSCLCGPSTVGTVRSCLVDVCVGYQICQADTITGDTAWTDCNAEDYNVEICDGLDNNCDGRIDEGYLNPASGRYEDDANCGFCNNDCSRYWTAELDHVLGICDIDTPGMPSCVMGSCLTETEDGLIYEWLDENTDPDDGCECRRRFGNIDEDQPDLIAYPSPALDYLDENCDGVDGVVTRALFVRAGSTNGDGSLTRPFGHIQEAIDIFASSGKAYVLVAEGRYDEDVQLVAGLQLHGGYAPDFRDRDVVLFASVIMGREATATLQADNIRGQSTMVSGFIIKGRDVAEQTPADTPGTPSIAVAIRDCDAALTLRSNRIEAGLGGAGGRGSSGSIGYGSQQDSLLDGGVGIQGRRARGPCPSGSINPGGRAGSNLVCASSNGQPGGRTLCPVCSPPSNLGNQAEYTSNDHGNGLGGYDWRFDDMSANTCSHATESGFPGNIQLNVGEDGSDGLDADNGLGGAGGAGALGSIAQGRWVADELDPGTAGGFGLAGDGGGGGGGGGGTAYFFDTWNDCPDYEQGPAGGGGGGGGCGGGGGQAGQQGGASLGALISHGAPGAQSITLTFNVFERGRGGAGGGGGAGGMGGLGGLGGFGGGPPYWISSKGGKGGDGGNGGPGGGGGGGAGGPSFDLLVLNSSTSTFASQNEFVLDDDVPTGGSGGDGGASVGSAAVGEIGSSGGHAGIMELTSCSSTGNCSGGLRCDPNGICIP